jgi:phosphoglycolate phosphatase
LKLLLFDIDGTLMLSGGAGRRAIDRAFLELHGISDAFGDVIPDGNTDPAIFRAIFANHDLRVGDGSPAFREVVECYVRHLPAEIRASDRAHLMPGAAALVRHLSRSDDLALGLLTGNFEATARIKLDRFGLNDFFPFGAFGSDDGVRTRLVPIAVERAEAHLGREIGIGPQVVIIGDTPQDVECAVVHGATAIGVAASRYSVADLEAAGANHALPTLDDIPAFMRAIGIDDRLSG